MNETLILVLAALLGLVMGSAVTALAWRLPRGVSWVSGRSACPTCGKPLTALDLIPVLSFAFARGRCRHCGARIGWRYPITELWCGLWAVLLAMRGGLHPWTPLLAIWGFMLVALTWIDYDYKLLPDALTFPGTLVGLAASVLQPRGIPNALFGLIVGAGGLWLVAWLYYRVRKIEGMGGGDIKLAAMFGVVLGPVLTLLTLFLAALAGSLWGGALMLRGRAHGRTELPFGTLLAPAAMIVLLFGDRWVSAYLGLMRH